MRPPNHARGVSTVHTFPQAFVSHVTAAAEPAIPLPTIAPAASKERFYRCKMPLARHVEKGLQLATMQSATNATRIARRARTRLKIARHARQVSFCMLTSLVGSVVRGTSQSILPVLLAIQLVRPAPRQPKVVLPATQPTVYKTVSANRSVRLENTRTLN